MSTKSVTPGWMFSKTCKRKSSSRCVLRRAAVLRKRPWRRREEEAHVAGTPTRTNTNYETADWRYNATAAAVVARGDQQKPIAYARAEPTRCTSAHFSTKCPKGTSASLQQRSCTSLETTSPAPRGVSWASFVAGALRELRLGSLSCLIMQA
jgi:hypothetical protein